MLPGGANAAARDLDRAGLERLLIDPEMDLAPDATFRATMLAPIQNVHGECLMATGQRAEIRDRPVETDQAQQAFDEAGRLPQGHTE